MDKDKEDVIGPDEPMADEACQALCPEKKPADAGEAMEIILDHAGAMGTYQRWLFVAMLPFGATMAFVYFTSIFTVATPQSYWCRVPELAHLDLELRRNLSVPGAITAGDDYEKWDRCHTFAANWTEVLETLQPPLHALIIPCRHGWDFQLRDVPYNTVVSERDWVCEYGTYVPLTQGAFFGGAFFGGLIFGWMADRFGRVPALVAANLVGFVGCLACIFTNTHWDFAVCRFIAGLSYDNCFMLVYILILEYVGAQHRTWVANLSIMLYFGGAAIVLPWLALWLLDWRLLTLITALPMLAALIAPLLLPESARWLASRGKHKRAVTMLRRLECINGTHIPQEALDDFVALSSNQKEETDETLKSVLASPRLRILLVLNVILYAACALVFDSLVRMSGSVGSNLFITFTISSATEIPSLLLVVLLLDRIGRRGMATGTFTLIGILAMIAAFVPKGPPRAWLAIAARFFSNMSFNTSIQWVTELLPTGARASGSSLVHVISFLAAAGSPFVVYLEQYWGGLPLVVTSAVALAAAGISLLLPETLGHAMPHSCADAERLVTYHSLLGKLLRGGTNKDIEDEPTGSGEENR